MMRTRREVPPWRERAEEARTIAEQMRDPDARRTMLLIAENYEALARVYEPVWAAGEKGVAASP